MAYADYTYYSGTYMGTMSEEDFSRLAVRASSFLDYYTRNKAKEYAGLEELQMACCALVDVYKLIETAKEKGVSVIDGKDAFKGHDRRAFI